MKSIYIKSTVLLFFAINTAYGQVGIGTTSPTSTLDIAAINPTGTTSNVDGITIPRVTRERAQSMVSIPTSTMIYINEAVTGTATGTTANVTTAGFYFYNGTAWEKINGAAASAGWSMTGNASTTPGTNFIGTTGTEDIRIKTNSTDRWNISHTNSGQLQSYSLGSAALPVYSFQGDQNTGIWSSGADALDFSTNGTQRMRIFSDGKITVNNTTAPTGSFFSSTSSAANPFALYGQSANNGSGVYGVITSGTTTYGGVQGEYLGTSEYGSGIVGFTSTNDAGTDFLGTNVAAIYGELGTGNLARSFGVSGTTGNNANGRTAGVIGTEYIRAGALGYYSNALVSYSIYGFGTAANTGGTGGRYSAGGGIDASIGLGVYGGVIGGWIKGNEYGTVVSGERFSAYNLGKVISNEDYIVISGKENKTVSYASTSLQPEINSKGVARLINGEASVNFEKAFAELIDKSKPVIVTCTPMGETKGVFLAEVTATGFRIKENQNGNANVSFSWIAIGEKNTSGRQAISPEILDKDFENNLNQVMHDENLDGGKAIWSENGTVKFGDKAPVNPAKTENYKKSSRRLQQNSQQEAKK